LGPAISTPTDVMSDNDVMMSNEVIERCLAEEPRAVPMSLGNRDGTGRSS
jgi:hypothetical protein